MKIQSTPRSLTCLALLLMLIPGAVLIGGSPEPVKGKTSSAVGIGGCPLFPANNIWNQDISTLPVHPNSANFIASIGSTGHMHADFGAGLYDGGPIGIPYTIVPGNQRYVPVRFGYADESDPGPYPIPSNAPIEGGSQSTGDRHVIVVDSGTCKLYEMFDSHPQSDGSWTAGSGAVWSLNSNALRPKTWTSADAAGLPILAGLVRYDEVASGAIHHALRFTVSRTQRAFLWPARHFASSQTNPNLPPMGLRLRLKASVNISGFSLQNRIILTALKHYGMIVADNGSSWFLSGAPDNRWSNDDLAQLSAIHGLDFEVIDESALQVSSDSGQSKLAAALPTPTPEPAATSTKVASSPAVAPTSVSLAAHNQRTGTKDEAVNGEKIGGGMNAVLLFVLGGMGVLAGVAGVWVIR